ncbi:Crp/Fnr family transcriptional regulator [Bacillus sp. B1-b2]|uniref:Crp/Fnr family transcriptional regulator n=1 Tax=Bacillus sp. B1-b2 TaxID=2653201 RepID=UPI001261FD42|nr:Crp/Fnr family transcriptional regulator [Bacillus sp. B1-b2]KAB7670046.1 Crp/Fnr family transcriptional regulator [Bacillus sp. B1-b2]
MHEVQLSLYSLLIQHFFDLDNLIQVKSGTLLFQEKDPVQKVYILLSGRLSLGRLHVNGKEFIIKILHEEDLLLEYQLFKHSPKYHFFAKTLTDCELIAIDRKSFEDLALNDPNTLISLTSYLSSGYIKANMKCQDLLMNGKKGGLYSILIRLSHSFGVRTNEGILIDLPITHQELANLCYGTREVIQRILKDLREREVISYCNKKITIKNLAYLKRAVDCQNCPADICGLN